VAAPGRTIVLAFDTATLDPGDSVHVRNAARGFVSQLSPADAIGVVTLPRGTAVAPTRDHAAALAVLSTVTGYHTNASVSYNMTAAEIIDMDADLEQTMVIGAGRGSIVPGSVLQQVQARECRSGGDSGCVAGIILEAEAQARLMHERAADTINGLNRLLRLLSEFPERKTVVLFSGGMAVGDRWIHDSGAIESLGRAAALANATVYAIHIDTGYQPVYNAEVRRARPTAGLGREREIQRALLSGFATTSGGDVFSAATGAGEFALRRVLLETSAVYALGIEPAPRDLDGKPHELHVRVQQRGVTLRNLRYVLLRSAKR
jgi:VWFA-related protein